MEPDVKVIKDFLIDNPEFIMDDIDILNSLLSSIPKQTGKNIVDLRGVFSERLEEKYSALEQTHKSVVAAAHANINTVKSINQAVLKILEVKNLSDLLKILDTDIKSIFNLSDIFFCLDNIEPLSESWPDHRCLLLMNEGECCRYINLQPGQVPAKNVLLRRVKSSEKFVDKSNRSTLSEAVISLTLSDSKEVCLLVMGSSNPEYFNPNQASDLLSFFARVLERHVNNFLFGNGIK